MLSLIKKLKKLTFECCRGVSLTAADVFFKFEKASVEKTEGEEKEDEEEKEKEEKGENEEEVKEKGEGMSRV